MSAADAYESWVEARGAAGVPGGFEDRVMARVSAPATAPHSLLCGLWRNPVVRAAVWVIGCGVVAVRLFGFLYLFWMS